MRNIWRELTYFVGFTEFFTNIPRQRVSYAWPREALAVGLGLTISTSVFTAITGKFTSMIGVAVALLGAAIVWSLCCIAWNTWLAVREEVGVKQPTPPPRGGYSPSPPTTLPSGPPPLPLDGTTPVTAPEREIRRLRAENAALTAAVQRVRALHNTFPDEKARWCRHCKTQEWPCPTLRALEDATEFDCPMCWRSYQSLTYEDVALCLQRGWCCDYCRAERQVRDSRPHQKEGTP